MYSQKWNCAASLFPKQYYNVLSPSSYTHISVRDLYISRIGLPILLQENMYVDRSWEYINRSQTHECGNWDWGHAIPRKGIHKWDFRCSVALFIPIRKCVQAEAGGGREETVPTGSWGGYPEISNTTLLQWKSYLCIPRKGIPQPRSQFSHSCVCERFKYSHHRSAYFAAGKYVDLSWKHIQ